MNTAPVYDTSGILEHKLAQSEETIRVLRIECDNKDEEIRKLKAELDRFGVWEHVTIYGF